MLTTVLIFIGAVIISYFFGNISFARIIASKQNRDITKMGSGNPGTMNMTRNFGWKIGLLTLILDIAKAVIPCLTARIIGSMYYPESFVRILVFSCGFSVILGHVFPLFFRFKGGKGIACALGIFAVLHPWWFLIFLGAGLILLLLFKIGSLTSLFMVTCLSVVAIIQRASWIEIILICAIYVLLIYAHRENLKRLSVGTESKIDILKKKDE